jgi:uncharacterized membrane protein YvbJ
MKKCNWCGQESEDFINQCEYCGSKFDEEIKEDVKKRNKKNASKE